MSSPSTRATRFPSCLKTTVRVAASKPDRSRKPKLRAQERVCTSAARFVRRRCWRLGPDVMRFTNEHHVRAPQGHARHEAHLPSVRSPTLRPRSQSDRVSDVRSALRAPAEPLVQARETFCTLLPARRDGAASRSSELSQCCPVADVAPVDFRTRWPWGTRPRRLRPKLQKTVSFSSRSRTTGMSSALLTTMRRILRTNDIRVS